MRDCCDKCNKTVDLEDASIRGPQVVAWNTTTGEIDFSCSLGETEMDSMREILGICHDAGDQLQLWCWSCLLYQLRRQTDKALSDYAEVS